MTKRIMITFAMVILMTAGALAETWTIDNTHSSVGFSVRHMVVSKTRGTFGKFAGTAEFDAKSLEGGSVNLTIETATIDTDDESRDGHLQTADFFDVEKFPTITFTSKKIIVGEGEAFQLIGDMTMKGITHEVTFDCTYYGTSTDDKGNVRAGFSAETTVDRREFDFEPSGVLAAGGFAIGNDVVITLELELMKNKSEEE